MGASLEKQQSHQGYHKGQSWAYYSFSCILTTYREVSAHSYVFSQTIPYYNYRQITEHEDEEILQKDINKLSEWVKLWQMNFNIAKCHTLRIRRFIRASKDQTSPMCMYIIWRENPCLMLSTIHISVLSSIVLCHGTYTWLIPARNQHAF